MNVYPLTRVILHSLGRQKWVFILIMSLAMVAGIGLMTLEKGVRQGSANVSNLFDLLITSPGSKIDAVLNLIYLQNEVIEPLTFEAWHPVMSDSRATWVSPIVKGDSVHGIPVIGVRESLVKAVYGAELSYSNLNSAFVGASTPFKVGEALTTTHGQLILDEAEAHHHHGNELVVQTRLPVTHTPWDHAILIPVEQVWATHSLSWHIKGRAPATLSPLNVENKPRLLSDDEWSLLDRAPSVVGMVVTPEKLSNAYALRASYSSAQSHAFFPAEVMVRLHNLMGQARTLFSVSSFISEILVTLGVLAGLSVWMQLLMPTFALVRVMGAPRRYIVLSVWCAMNGLVCVSVLLALAIVVLAGLPVANWVAQVFSFSVPFQLGWSELQFVLWLACLSSALSIWPAFQVSRQSLSNLVRQL